MPFKAINEENINKKEAASERQPQTKNQF